jgi:hypothetical protein
MVRFMTKTCLAFHTYGSTGRVVSLMWPQLLQQQLGALNARRRTSSTGMPAMTELGSSIAAELTVSLAPVHGEDRWVMHDVHNANAAIGRTCPLKVIRCNTCDMSGVARTESMRRTNHQRHIRIAKLRIDFLHLY